MEVNLQSLKSRGKITIRNESEGNNTIALNNIYYTSTPSGFLFVIILDKVRVKLIKF